MNKLILNTRSWRTILREALTSIQIISLYTCRAVVRKGTCWAWGWTLVENFQRRSEGWHYDVFLFDISLDFVDVLSNIVLFWEGEGVVFFHEYSHILCLTPVNKTRKIFCYCYGVDGCLVGVDSLFKNILSANKLIEEDLRGNTMNLYHLSIRWKRNINSKKRYSECLTEYKLIPIVIIDSHFLTGDFKGN